MKRSCAFLLTFTVSALGEFAFPRFRTSLFTLTLNVNHFLSDMILVIVEWDLTVNILHDDFIICYFVEFSVHMCLYLSNKNGKLVSGRKFNYSTPKINLMFVSLDQEAKRQKHHVHAKIHSLEVLGASSYLLTIALVVTNSFNCISSANNIIKITVAFTSMPHVWSRTSFFVPVVLCWINCCRFFECIYLLTLSFKLFMGLFMVRGHKGFSLWPKASPWNDPFKSLESQFYCHLVAILSGHFDYALIILFYMRFSLSRVTYSMCFTLLAFCPLRNQVKDDNSISMMLLETLNLCLTQNLSWTLVKNSSSLFLELYSIRTNLFVGASVLSRTALSFSLQLFDLVAIDCRLLGSTASRIDDVDFVMFITVYGE